MKNIKLFSFVLGFFSLIVFGQNQKYFFKQEYFPNSEYEIQNRTNMTSDIRIIGNKNILKSIHSNNMGIKMTMDYTSNLITEIPKGNNIPFSYKFSKMTSEMEIGGIKRNMNSPFESVKIIGEFIDGKIMKFNEIDTEGKENAYVKELMNRIKNGMAVYQYVEFPTKGLKIGESFIQSFPYKLDALDKIDGELEANITYILKEVKDNKAFFDLLVDMKMNFDIKSDDTHHQKINESNISGSGTGKMVFDSLINQPINTSMEINLDMNMQIEDDKKQKISINTKNTISTIVAVEKIK